MFVMATRPEASDFGLQASKAVTTPLPWWQRRYRRDDVQGDDAISPVLGERYDQV